MKDEIKRILNELQTSKGIETLKLDYQDVDDYRDKGYYVLCPIEMDDYFEDVSYTNPREYLCYLSKDSLKLDRKHASMKSSDEWIMYSPY